MNVDDWGGGGGGWGGGGGGYQRPAMSTRDVTTPSSHGAVTQLTRFAPPWTTPFGTSSGRAASQEDPKVPRAVMVAFCS